MRGTLRTVALALVLCTPHALQAAAEEARQIDIPAGDLTQALETLARAAAIEIVYRSDHVQGLRTRGVSGFLRPRDALAQLLEGTRLTLRVDPSGAILVTTERQDARSTSVTRRSRETESGARLSSSASEPRVRDARTAGRSSALGARELRDSAQLEEVTVTGSRIARLALESPVPVTSISRLELLESGHLNVADALVEIPGVEYDVSLTNSQTATHASGLSTVSLRNLGPNRTLVLIDGRRTVSNSVSSSRVSLDTIPLDLIERIEVTTGGASAVYGSDAVAGVVNIITQSDLTGVRTTVRAGALDEGGNKEEAVSLTAGTRFAADRGRSLLAVSWDRNAGLRASERDWAMRPVAYDAAANRVIEPDLRSAIPGGRFEGRRFFFNEQGLARGFETARDGYNDRPEGTLIIPRRRFLAAGKVDLALDGLPRFFAHVGHASIDTNSPRRPDGLDSAELALAGASGAPENGGIPISNPLVPADIADDAMLRGRNSIEFVRRFSEVGPQERRNARETWRAWMGADGQIGDRWRWEAAYGYGAFEFEQVRTNGIHLSNLRKALDAERDPLEDSRLRCRDAIARAQGCVPVNLFGIGSISQAAAAYIRAPAVLSGRLRQDVWSANMSGALPGLSAADVRIAFGAEHRREQQAVRSDPLSATGATSFTPIPSITGRFDVTEAFIEALVPLLGAKRFAYDLGIEAALRVADYDQPNVSTVSSFKLGAHWAPSADVRVRAQLARAQRAPDITELFSPARGDYDNVDDPCNDVTAETTGAVARNCRATPGVAAQIETDGVFRQTTRNVFAPNAGNPRLHEETADTVTAGIVLTPRFAPGLWASVDYYHIELDDGIDAIGSQQLLDECYGAELDFPANPFCRAIDRAASGQLSQILNQEQNLNRQVSAGIDASLRYSMPLQWLAGLPGALDLSLQHTHVLELSQAYGGDEGERLMDEQRGEIGNFADRWRATLGWAHGGWRVRWRARYLSAAVDSVERAAFFADRGVEEPLFLRVPSYITHDLYMHYEPGGDARLRLALGANNLFNEISPFLPLGTDSGNAANFNGVYDIGGRFLYGQVSVTF